VVKARGAPATACSHRAVLGYIAASRRFLLCDICGGVRTAVQFTGDGGVGDGGVEFVVVDASQCDQMIGDDARSTLCGVGRREDGGGDCMVIQMSEIFSYIQLVYKQGIVDADERNCLI
jgi:hypothetical protein